MFRDLGDRQGLVEALEGLAVAYGPAPEAARLFGAAQALRVGLGAERPMVEQPDYEQTLAAVRRALGDEQFEAAWRAGQALPLQQVVGHALGQPA
jgi:hypothetical protein